MNNESTKCYFTGTDCLPTLPIFTIEGHVYNSKLCGQYKFFSEHKNCIDSVHKNM